MLQQVASNPASIVEVGSGTSGAPSDVTMAMDWLEQGARAEAVEIQEDNEGEASGLVVEEGGVEVALDLVRAAAASVVHV